VGGAARVPRPRARRALREPRLRRAAHAPLRAGEVRPGRARPGHEGRGDRRARDAAGGAGSVRRRLVGPGAAAAVGALGVAAAVVAGASLRTAGDAYLLFLGAVAALALVQAAAGERPEASAFERARVR